MRRANGAKSLSCSQLMRSSDSSEVRSVKGAKSLSCSQLERLSDLSEVRPANGVKSLSCWQLERLNDWNSEVRLASGERSLSFLASDEAERLEGSEACKRGQVAAETKAVEEIKQLKRDETLQLKRNSI